LGEEAVSDRGESPGPDLEELVQELEKEYGQPEASSPDSAGREATEEAVPEPLHTEVLQQVHDAQPATPGPASSPAAGRKGVAAIADNKVVAAILRTTIGRVIVGAIVGAVLGLAVALPRVDESRPRHRPADYGAVVSFVIGIAVLGAFMGASTRLKSSRFRRLADPRVGSGIAGAIVGATVGTWIALPSKAGGPIDVPELAIWVLGGALVGAVVGIVWYSRRARQG
jgi:hypothetical protein